jgi:diguanylate cyclase (GGDEF)-like protein
MYSKSANQLRELISSKAWQEHFAILTQTLGFTLKVYTDSRQLLYASPGREALCSPLAGSSGFHQKCEGTCMNIVAEVLASGERRLFTCAARIVSFALLIEHLGERAVVMGHGSFASYPEYRIYLDLLRIYAPEAELPIISTLRYTTHHDAWSSSFVVGRSIHLLLESHQENIALQQKMMDMQEVIGWWGGPGEQDEASLYQRLLRSLRGLYDIKHASISIRVSPMNAYQPITSDVWSESGAGLTFSGDDRIVQELRSTRSSIAMPGGALGPRPGLDGAETWYFVPLQVRNELDGILSVAGGMLLENDMQIVAALARQTALVIENRRLQTDLFAKLNRLASIADLTKEIYTIRDYKQLLNSIIEKSSELLMAEQGSLMLLERDADMLLLAARKGDRGVYGLRVPAGEGIAGRVAVKGEPLLVENVEQDPRTRQKNREHYRTPSFISVPLKIGDQSIGVLNFADKITGEVFDQEDLQLIVSFATHAAMVLERNDLYRQTEQLRSLSTTDPLTGVCNRRAFQERFEEEIERARRHGRQISLLMMDIDRFKTVNDQHGHRTGDRVIKMVAASVLKAVRSIDIVARYGGDEFVVILPETEQEIAELIGERIRREVQADRVPAQDGAGAETIAVTVSIGAATGPREEDTAETLLERADKGLYQAKARGRNCIESA